MAMQDVIRSGPDLWEFFVDRAGLEPDGWDAQLVADLRQTLGLAPAPAGITEQLKIAGTSVEDLLVSLLAALEPFGAMLADLLELFVRTGVHSNGDTTAIEFDFDYDSGALRFELDAFRRARSVLREAQAHAAVRVWTADALWRLGSALSGSPSEGMRVMQTPSVIEPVASWLREYDSGRWAQQALPVPKSDHAELDQRLERVWQVWEWVLAQAQALAPERDTLGYRWHEQRRASNFGEAPEDPLLELIGLIDSDRWLAAIAERAYDLAGRVQDTGSSSTLATTAIDQIDAALPTPEEQQRQQKQLVEELEDLLDLPFWKHRHELFSAWVFTRIVDALAPAEIDLHHNDGVLRFAFAATHLATARLPDKVVSVWSEVRSPLLDPLGSSRVANIQPDYSLVPGDSGDFAPEQSLLEIECKQYKSANTKAFAEALADYGRGRPRAEVVLVDHGPVDAGRVLSRPELGAVRPRAHVVGSFQPEQEQSLRKFATLTRGAMWPHLTSVAVPVGPPPRPSEMSPMAVRVAHTPAPDDVELHLFVTIDGGTFHVHEGAAGQLHRSPFACHEAACPPVVEQIRIERQDRASYDIFVHVPGSALPGSAADLELSWERQAAKLASGWIGPGGWWHAFVVKPSGTVLFVNKISATPPASVQ